MDVAGALLEGVLPQPVDHVDDVLVVGVELAIALAQLHQLLEIAGAGTAVAGAVGALDRARQVVELDLVAADVIRVGQHAAKLQPQHLAQLLLPLLDVRLAGGDDGVTRGHFHRQDLEARRVLVRHHRRHRGEIDLQRINVVVGHAGLAGQPFGEPLQRQQPLRRLR